MICNSVKSFHQTFCAGHCKVAREVVGGPRGPIVIIILLVILQSVVCSVTVSDLLIKYFVWVTLYKVAL